jgi:DHA1 family tetracycline resistance protein-like MFS transporter
MSQTPTPSQPRYDRRLVTILAIVFAQLLGASMILPVLTLYAVNQLGMPKETAPLLQAAFFISQFLAAPFLGRWSDRYGRVPILLISQIGTVVSYLMIAFAPSIGMLFASRILDGVTGGNIIVAQAYVIDITPRERRTQALGLIFAVFGLGFIIGPSIGGAIAALVGQQALFFTAALVTLIPTIMTHFTLNETLTAEERMANRARGALSFREMLSNRTVLNILATTMFGSFGLGIVQSTFAIYGQDILFTGKDEAAVNLGVGLLLGAVGLGQTITQTLILRRLLRYYGDAPLVLGGTLIRAFSQFWYFILGLPIALALFGQEALPFIAIIGAMTFAMGTGIMMPPLQSLVTYAAPDHARGAVVGLASSAQSLGVIAGTLLAGPLLGIEIAGRPSLAPYLTNAVMFSLLAVPAWFLVRRFGTQPNTRPDFGSPKEAPAPAAD